MAAAPLQPPSSSLSRVNPDTIGRAATALLKWKNSRSKNEKPQLLEQDEFIYLVVTLKKIPGKARTNPHKIVLPHHLHHSPLDSSSELCLIIDDRSKSKLTSADAKKKIKSEDIPVTKVIKLSKLRSDYRPFEAKRKLCDSYDMFFADKRVIPVLPKLLGKQFFKKKKIPVPVDLTHKNWKEQIDRACSSALFFMTTGTCSVVKVGKVSMGTEEIVENVVAAIEGVVEVVPKKWSGLRSLHLKFSESLALPLYQTLPDMRLRIEGTKDNEEKSDKKEEEEVGGDLDKEESGKEDEEKSSKKKVAKKGRINKVRYMDTNVDQDVDDSGDDKDEGTAEVGDKKRKKGDLAKRQVPSGLNARKGKKMRKVDTKEEGDDMQKKDKEKSIEKKGNKKSALAMKSKDREVKTKDKKVKRKATA